MPSTFRGGRRTFRISSADSRYGNGSWNCAGEFSVSLHENTDLAQGVSGIKLLSASIPNTQPNITTYNNTLCVISHDGTESTYNATVPTSTDVSFDFIINGKGAESVTVTVSLVSPRTANQLQDDFKSALDAVSVPASWPTLSGPPSTMSDILAFRPAGNNTWLEAGGFYEIVSQYPNVSFRMDAVTDLVKNIMGFDNTQAFGTVFYANRPTAAAKITVSPGQWDIADLTGALETELSNDLPGSWLVDQPFGLQNTNVQIRRDGGTENLILYESPSYSGLAHVLGFTMFPGGRSFLASGTLFQPDGTVDPAGDLSAPQLPSLQGCIKIFIESNLARDARSFVADGSRNYIKAIPVNVSFGSTIHYTSDSDRLDIHYKTTQSFSQVAVRLVDENGCPFRPQSGDVVLWFQTVVN